MTGTQLLGSIEFFRVDAIPNSIQLAGLNSVSS
jgi:hypothetical protein